MNVKSWQEPSRNNHPKVEEWLESYMESVFKQLEDLTRALENRLDFSTNFKSVLREVALKSGETVRIKIPGIEWKPVGVIAVGETIYYRKMKWTLASLSEVEVTVKFENSDGTEPKEEVKTRLLIFGN